MRTFRKSYWKHACESIRAKQQFMTNSVCVIFASFQPEVQSFGALAQSTNSPAVRILPSDFKSLRLRARHAFGTFGEYRTRQKDYDRASASKSDYWVGNPKCSLAFHRARACKRVVWGIAEQSTIVTLGTRIVLIRPHSYNYVYKCINTMVGRGYLITGVAVDWLRFAYHQQHRWSLT